MDKNWKIETLAVQAGYEPGNGDARIVPIVQSTTYKYDDAQSVADLFDLKREGFFYTRLANPTVAAFEGKIAAMEKGVAAVALSSGQAANAFSLMNVARCGDHVLALSSLYGGTVSLFTNTLKKAGIEITFVTPEDDYDKIVANIRPNTKALFIEALANPALVVADFELYAKAAHDNGIPLIVDNTFPTPYLCNPFDFGADIVTHSTTKYLDGHATSVGGIVVEKGDFNWANGKFPEFTEPDKSYHGLIYTRDFAAMPFSVKLRVQLVRDYGMPMMPFNGFLTHLGVETLALRMERHSSNALELAKFLAAHPAVSWVNYPGLPDNPEYARAQKYFRNGMASGVLCFGVKGGAKAGEKVMNSLKLANIVVHVADVRTGVLHPASMTHRQLTEQELIDAGVSPDLIRVSVGIENIEDIKADFDQALAAAADLR
ncbi:MAG: O-acetylhomoserine aminocarboxypropyltransferase/cysteine synthase [Lentisphaeria bacterium]|nr:O-acetylhomoserine aminocarboxypropyltransferase/cysteine synthase [Lentisphaeria bacterium]